MAIRALLAALAVPLVAASAAPAAWLGEGAAPVSARVATTATTTASTSTASTATTATTATLPTTTALPTTTTTPGAAIPPASASGSVTLLLSGRGWGHGLGLSQWGARGYALRGWTYDTILAHYYRGTTLGPASVTKVRVLLADGAKGLRLASTTAWAVVDGAGQTHALDAGTVALGVALRLTPSGATEPTSLPPPLSFVPRGAPLQLAGKAYRGSIQVVKDDQGKLEAIDVVGLEDYLRGVVPSEMPSTWPAEALKAQAVAARSYALAQRAAAKPYDLFADVRSQVYGGIAAESTSASAAIEATRGQVVLYKGVVADTLFFSSSGGRTASYAEAFSGKPVPYLVSVADPYDASPYTRWGPVAVDGALAAKALGLPGPLQDMSFTTGPSGRAVTATLTVPGSTKTVRGGDLRAKLGLRSTWIESVGLLSLRPSKPSLTYGGGTALEGRVRDVDGPLLEQRVAGGAWTPGPALPLAADGSFRLAVKPAKTTEYRLVAGTVRARAARLAVAPAVRLDTGFGGVVKPAAGKTVDVQVQEGSTWLTVATVPVDAAGSFAAGDLGPGTYRARYAPGGGLVAGVSASLTVQ